MTEDKLKWTITIDLMMIIGKYLENNQDFINIIQQWVANPQNLKRQC